MVGVLCTPTVLSNAARRDDCNGGGFVSVPT